MKEYIVGARDVGKHAFSGIYSRCEECGSLISDFPFAPLAKVLKCDIGKKCFKVNGHWYVENQEQFERRIGKKT
jgi:hypothetical protein